MPFGEHWEWRGFGHASPQFRAWFQSLPPLYPPNKALLRDAYLWTPGCMHNVKLRSDALKLKRFIARQGAFERWLEDPRDLLPFPLHPEHVRQVQALLNAHFPSIPQEPASREAFLALVARARPPVRVIVALKQRRLSRWRLPSGEEVIVEWTQLHQPERVETVAMEHDNLQTLIRAWEGLSSHLAGLRPMNYLTFIARWAGD
ncbi:MAG TPA: hypothetical protein G4O05_00685 [Caldilineae bacterium]|nr:hypothetical protein [Caldilineae bacterium]